MWDGWDVECSGYGMLGMWDAWDVEYSGCEMFGMWDVRDVGCWKCGILGMWVVWNVGCLGCGMLGVWDLGCGMFSRMWDVDLQNALKLLVITTYDSPISNFIKSSGRI